MPVTPWAMPRASFRAEYVLPLPEPPERPIDKFNGSFISDIGINLMVMVKFLSSVALASLVWLGKYRGLVFVESRTQIIRG